MKLPALAGLAFVAALSIGTSAFAQATPGRAAPAPAAKSAPPAAAAGKPAPAPQKEKEKEAPPKIDGMTIERRNGTFLGLQIVNNNFVVKFYDKEKKPAKPDVARATARWPVKYQPADERTVLNRVEDTLTSAFVIRPPHQFKLTLSLLSEVEGTPAETYIVDFRE